MKVIAEEINHREQRYDTVGDYQVDSVPSLLASEEIYRFKITRTEDWRSAAAVFLHEFVEAMLAKERGITIETIDAWDSGPKGQLSREPGEIPGCPYAREHCFAENLERLFVAELGLSWTDHVVELRNARHA